MPHLTTKFKTLLLAQYKFNLDPNAVNWHDVEEAMYAYQDEVYGDHSPPEIHTVE